MHKLAGLTLGDWGSAVTVLAFLMSLLGLFLKYAVFAPFQGDIKELNGNFKLLNHNLAELKSEIDRLDKKTAEHDRRLDRHHERIKGLKGDKYDED